MLRRESTRPARVPLFVEAFTTSDAKRGDNVAPFSLFTRSTRERRYHLRPVFFPVPAKLKVTALALVPTFNEAVLDPMSLAMNV